EASRLALPQRGVLEHRVGECVEASALVPVLGKHTVDAAEMAHGGRRCGIERGGEAPDHGIAHDVGGKGEPLHQTALRDCSASKRAMASVTAPGRSRSTVTGICSSPPRPSSSPCSTETRTTPGIAVSTM